MKKLIISIGMVVIAIIAVVTLKYIPGLSVFLWDISKNGSWLLPLVFFSAVLDSVHPCSFSILLITIAFLFSLQISRKKIIQIGVLYIAGIFMSYFLIGIGILQVIHIFNIPHFMGKVGASLLIAFGILNLLNYLFPSFPIKLKIPSVAHSAMGKLMERASFSAAFGLGILVGLCQFPCMGGPYLMVIGLLHDHSTYFKGLGYLFLYNIILVLPLVATLWIAADPTLLDKIGKWKQTQMKSVHLWAGVAMVIVGILVLFI